MENDQSLRKHLVSLLTGENAHVNFESAIKGVSKALRGKRPRGEPIVDPAEMPADFMDTSTTQTGPTEKLP